MFLDNVSALPLQPSVVRVGAVVTGVGTIRALAPLQILRIGHSV